MRPLQGLFTLALLALAPAAAAQPPAPKYYSGQGTITCESTRGYRECFTGFRAPPRMIQQLSGSPCVEGRSWGHRMGMVWVAQGCRAVFEETRGWAGPGPGAGGAGSILCESRDNRRRECPARFRGQVEVVQQLSQTPCIEGRTWGQSRYGIWVDRGCRARFGEFYGSVGGGGHWGPGTGYRVVCESQDRRHRRCDWDWGRGIPYLERQLSHTPCVRNRSWGYDARRRDLWVSEGCRGVFVSR
jgi:hypothetical protein